MKHMNTFLPFCLFCLTLFISSLSHSQSVFNVEVSNFEFTPNNLDISVGDTVRWTNVSGSHNVNGTLALFPSNPIAFSNLSDGSGTWVFDFVFTIAGEYQYQCGIHGPNMSGSITVHSTASISELQEGGLLISPNPVHASFTVEHSKGIESIEIYDLKGQRVLLLPGNLQKQISIKNHNLEPGRYLCRIYDESGKSISASFIKK